MEMPKYRGTIIATSTAKYKRLNLVLTSIAVTLIAKWFVFTLALVQAALGAAFGIL